jgi:hypothetical protein
MGKLYYFDRIWIYAMENSETIKNRLPFNQLQKTSRSFDLKCKSAFSEFTKYQCWIEIVAPTPACLEILYKHEQAIGDYRISHLEIAKDVRRPTALEADEETRKLIIHTRKKWSRDRRIYDQHDFAISPTSEDPEKWGTITGKERSKYFGFRQYARTSKISGMPSVHQEFFLFSPKQIQQRTGISEIGDLLGFNISKWFEDTTKKYLITDETIDKILLGKWLLNWTNKRKFTKRNLITIELVAQQFLVYKNVFNYPSLVDYFKQAKKDIRSKSGIKNKWDLQVLNLSNYGRFKT